jgi:DNA-binding NarL/FixJ family response regulator
MRISPRVKVLIASVAAAIETTEDALASGAKGLLRKPFKMDEMLRAVSHVLDSE